MVLSVACDLIPSASECPLKFYQGSYIHERASTEMLRTAKRVVLMSALPVHMPHAYLVANSADVVHAALHRHLCHLLDAAVDHASYDSHGTPQRTGAYVIAYHPRTGAFGFD